MDADEYRLMHQVEDHHWWYRGMSSISRAILNRRYAPAGVLKILDAGCGTGGAASAFLLEYGSVTGLDCHPEALRYCRQRGLQRLIRASVDRLPYADRSFDLVTSFDVLYERSVPSDLRALAEAVRVLVPGGRILLRVPAYSWMRRQHDTVVHTARRYSCRDVAFLFRESGLIVEVLSYANTILFPAALAKKLLEQVFPARKPQSDLTINLWPLNKVFRRMLSVEAPFVARSRLPYGLSVFALGRKL
jgi:SAM-dependent methyltransferase